MKSEQGTAYLNQKISDLLQGPFYISHLALLEFTSVIHRRHRKGLETLIELRKAEATFAQLIATGRFQVLEVTPDIINEAELLIRNVGAQRECQTYDAIQLSTALELQRRIGLTELLSADKGLLSLAKSLGLPTIDPETV